jgi:flavin reductase ActVB
VSLSELREVLAQVAMPVAIVTALDRSGAAHGLTVGSLCSLSMTPPLVLVCIDRRGVSGRRVVEAGRFGVSVLSADQHELAQSFAAPGRHEVGPGFSTVDGLPAVRDALAFLGCSRHAVLDGGDHHILIGRVDAVARDAVAPPLVYHDRQYGRVDTACLRTT